MEQQFRAWSSPECNSRRFGRAEGGRRGLPGGARRPRWCCPVRSRAGRSRVTFTTRGDLPWAAQAAAPSAGEPGFVHKRLKGRWPLPLDGVRAPAPAEPGSAAHCPLVPQRSATALPRTERPDGAGRGGITG